MVALMLIEIRVCVGLFTGVASRLFVRKDVPSHVEQVFNDREAWVPDHVYPVGDEAQLELLEAQDRCGGFFVGAPKQFADAQKYAYHLAEISSLKYGPKHASTLYFGERLAIPLLLRDDAASAQAILEDITAIQSNTFGVDYRENLPITSALVYYPA